MTDRGGNRRIIRQSRQGNGFHPMGNGIAFGAGINNGDSS